MQEVFSYMKDTVPYILISVPIILLFRFWKIKHLEKSGFHTTVYHETTLFLFLIFSVALSAMTVIPKIEITDKARLMLNFDCSRINFMPFTVITQTWRSVFVNGNMSYFLTNLIGNIILFMPIGFFVPLLWNRVSFGKTILIGFLTSLTIEICQLAIARGTDIDDLWLNTLGTLLGYALYASVNKFKPYFTDKFKIQEHLK